MTKKSRFIPLLLAVLLLFTACAPGNSARGKELGYFNYPGLDWGMNEAEFFRAMGKNADAFIREDRYSGYEAGADPTTGHLMGYYYTLTGGEFLGIEATVAFYFDVVIEGVDPYLDSVQIELTGEYDIEKLPDRLIAFAEEQSVAVNSMNSMSITQTDRNGKERSSFNNKVFEGDDVASAFAQYSMTAVATGGDVLDEALLEQAKRGYFSLYPDPDERIMSALATNFHDTFVVGELSKLWFIYNVELDENGEKTDERITITMSGTIGTIEALAEYAEKTE